MKLAVVLVGTLALASCAGTPRLDACKDTAIRRGLYQAMIDRPTLLASAGCPVPRPVALAAAGAQEGLWVLNMNCPGEPAQE